MNLKKELMQLTGAIFQHAALLEQGNRDEWVANVYKRHHAVLEVSEKAHEIKKAWLSTVEEIWDQLQERACSELKTTIDRLSPNGSLWIIIYLKLFQLELKNLQAQIVSEIEPRVTSLDASEEQEAEPKYR